MAKEIAAAREALAVHLPEAVRVFGELLQHPEADIRLRAAAEIADRTIGKPKPMDVDTETAVRAELAAVFARLREKLEPNVYRSLIVEIAQEGK